MARRESQAVAGFFPTPLPVVALAAGILDPGPRAGVVMDPCAGEGVAAAAMAARLGPQTGQLLVELEMTRARAIPTPSYNVTVVQGDFFFLEMYPSAADVLWLNPPYDLDKVYGRLEEKFLRRALPYLKDSGILFFVVPFYALTTSAATLAQHLDAVSCFRFPDREYAAYQQVVLIGRKVRRAFPDPDVLSQIMAWASNPTTLPTEPSRRYAASSANLTYASVPRLRMSGYDGAAVAKLDPWRGVRGLIPNLGVEDNPLDRFHRTFPVASVPRAAHLSAALASGIFNGTRVEPNEGSDLPPILLKGTFDKEFRTVEEKFNKKGEKVAEVQVQQPKLSVTVLDLRSGSFHTIQQATTLSAVASIETLTMADLLEHYGRSLMQKMLDACPVLHDPRRGDVGVPANLYVKRPLYDAQVGVVQTCVKMYEQDPHRGVILLGEIGAGKSGCALATAAVLKARRVLIMCPPHLLDGWRDQCAAVLPTAAFHVLSSISDVDAFFAPPEPLEGLPAFFRELSAMPGNAEPAEDLRVGVVSREKAKLGHTWRSAQGRCPRCGVRLAKDHDYAAKRTTCEEIVTTPRDPVARWLKDHAALLARYVPKHPVVQTFTRRMRLPSRPAQAPDATLAQALWGLKDRITSSYELQLWATWACPEFVRDLAPHLNPPDLRLFYLALRPEEVTEDMMPKNVLGGESWGSWHRFHQYLHGEASFPSYNYSFYNHRFVDGHPSLHNVQLASRQALERLLDALVHLGSFEQRPCGEFLYQAVPEPRRYPLATYVSKRHLRKVDFLVLDEAHELSSEGAAQTHAAQRLLNAKCQKMLLSGSFTNGYADSAFMNMWGTSPRFRADFKRADLTRFIDRYGYWKRVVSEEDFQGEVIEFGSTTDRVTRSRKAGIAPGIHPLFQLEHLLPSAVTLQKADLRIGIPPLTEHGGIVSALSEQERNLTYLTKELMETIKKHRKDPRLSGKLWGAMSELPAYLDLACVGNVPGESIYRVAWPDTAEEYANLVIAEVPLLPPTMLLPKEERMLRFVQEQRAQGRPSMVFGWHTLLLPRLVQLLRAAGLNTAYLEADRVPTQKRQGWIDREVVAKDKEVLVVNPVTVQTGLNNLVYFANEFWMENPGCNPVAYTQPVGRIDRIGQTRPTWVEFPVYLGQQEVLYKLLLHKVGVSKAVDGLDPEAALRAAGLIDEAFNGFAVGKHLYEAIMKGL